jgi:soluble lytic murein transglycosylase
MMRSIVVVIQLFFAVNLYAQGALNSATALKAGSLKEEELHAAIIESVDTQKFSVTAQLLDGLKQKYPARYTNFPYRLLHAKTLVLSNDLTHASEIYRSLMQDPYLNRFAELPLARISVIQGKTEDALKFYHLYLEDKKNPDYPIVSTEALDFALLQNRPEDVIELSNVIMKQPNCVRLGRFYLARAYLAKKEVETARTVFRELLRGPKDDIASLALTELDKLEGNQLTEEERVQRAKVAHEVWNFELVKKYLKGLALSNIQNAYYYGRALSFLGEFEEAKKIFQSAAGMWPEDPLSKLCLFQYAAAALHQGDLTKAEEIYKNLIQEARSSMVRSATLKLVEVLRAQSRFDEALQVLDTAQAKRSVEKDRAVFTKARIRFQMNRYQEALADLNRLLPQKQTTRKREFLFWKGMVLKRMQQKKEAAGVFLSLKSGFDYYGLLASEELENLGIIEPETLKVNQEDFRPLRLPDQTVEERILELASKGDLLPAFLYLHLYEEATPLLNSISADTWNLLGVDSKNARNRYLALAELAGLSGVYSNANYYSEIFLQGLPAMGSTAGLSNDLLKILFPLPYNEEILKFSKQRKLDPFLVLSIMKQESKFKRFAKSPAFARGLMQLIPSTATQLAADLNLANFSVDQLYHPELNINLGTKYVQDMVSHFGNRLELIAASYNGGEANVRRWLACTSTTEPIEFFSNIDFPETRDYVMKVRINYEWYKRVYGKSPRMDSTAGLP